MVDPNISAYFRHLQSLRRKRVLPFLQDRELASRAGKLGREKQLNAKKNSPEAEDTPEKGHDPKDDEPTQEVPQWQ